MRPFLCQKILQRPSNPPWNRGPFEVLASPPFRGRAEGFGFVEKMGIQGEWGDKGNNKVTQPSPKWDKWWLVDLLILVEKYSFFLNFFLRTKWRIVKGRTPARFSEKVALEGGTFGNPWGYDHWVWPTGTSTFLMEMSFSAQHEQNWWNGPSGPKTHEAFPIGSHMSHPTIFEGFCALVNILFKHLLNHTQSDFKSRVRLTTPMIIIKTLASLNGSTYACPALAWLLRKSSL